MVAYAYVVCILMFVLTIVSIFSLVISILSRKEAIQSRIDVGYSSGITSKKLDDLRGAVNSRLTDLLTLTESAALARGILEGQKDKAKT